MSAHPSTTGDYGRGTSRLFGRAFIYGLLLVAAVVYLVPLYVVLVTSFKSVEELRGGQMMALPTDFTFAPWVKAWSGACVGLACDGIRGFFGNTVIITVPAVAISTFLGALNGFVLTKWRFPGHRIVFVLMLFGCFIPFQVILIPAARVLGLLGIAGSPLGLIVIHVAYGLGFSTLFFRNYFVSLPDELVRAAQVDGAGFFTIFFRIILPISIPAVIVTVIFQFTNIWNDFIFGATFAAGSGAPIMVALNNLVQSMQGVKEYNVDMAAAVIAALPTLLVYVVAGRYFVRGLMAGAVKG